MEVIEYKKQLQKNGLSIKALNLLLDNVKTDTKTDKITYIEGLKKENWLKLDSKKFESLPNQYFNIILVQGSDLKICLQQINKIYSKLVYGGRVYFSNLLENFDSLVQKCLDIQIQIFSSNYNIASVLQYLVDSNPNQKWHVQLKYVTGGNFEDIVFIKDPQIKFDPDNALLLEINMIDKKYH
jgi:hypothetical protein